MPIINYEHTCWMCIHTYTAVCKSMGTLTYFTNMYYMNMKILIVACEKVDTLPFPKSQNFNLLGLNGLIKDRYAGQEVALGITIPESIKKVNNQIHQG